MSGVPLDFILVEPLHLGSPRARIVGGKRDSGGGAPLGPYSGFLDDSYDGPILKKLLSRKIKNDRALFWEAVNQSSWALAKSICEKNSEIIFKDPNFLKALDAALLIVIDKLDDIDGDGGIEFFRDWLLQDKVLGSHCDKNYLTACRITFLDVLFKKECWEFLEEALLKKEYQGFEIWTYSDGYLPKMLESLFARTFETCETWQLPDSHPESDGKPISFLEYCMRNNFHVLTFYLLAFDYGYSLNDEDVLCDFDYSLLFLKEDIAAKKRLLIFATLLGIQDKLFASEDLVVLKMNGLDALRSEILDAIVLRADWRALNRSLMASGYFNPEGAKKILEILDVPDNGKFKKTLIQKMQKLTPMRSKLASGDTILEKYPLLELVVLKSYVGLLGLILALSAKDDLKLDLILFKRVFNLDAEKVSDSRISAFTHVLKIQPALIDVVNNLLRDPTVQEPRSVSSESISPEGEGVAPTGLLLISTRPPGVSLVVAPGTKFVPLSSTSVGAGCGAGGPGSLPVL